MKIIILGSDRTEKIKTIFGEGHNFSDIENSFQEILKNPGPFLLIKSNMKSVVKPATMNKMLNKVLEKEFDLFYLYKGENLFPNAVLFSESGLEKLRNLDPEDIDSIISSLVTKKKLDVIFSKPNIVEPISDLEKNSEMRETIKKEIEKENLVQKINTDIENIIHEEYKTPPPSPPRKKLIDYKSVMVEDDYETDENLSEKLSKTFGSKEIVYAVIIFIIFIIVVIVFRK